MNIQKASFHDKILSNSAWPIMKPNQTRTFNIHGISLNYRKKVKLPSRVQLCNPMDCSLSRLLCPWNFPGKNTGVGCHFLLQGIFLTQGLNLGLQHCRKTLYCLSHQGSQKNYSYSCNCQGSSVHRILQARKLEWVAMPSSRGSSQPRDRAQVSHIAGVFFTSWATREAQEYWSG